MRRERSGMAPGSCCERRRGERSAGTSAGPGRSMKPWAEGMNPLSEPGPPPDSPPSPEDAHIFPSPFAFFFFPSLPRFRCQAQDWTRRDAGTGSAAFPSSQSGGAGAASTSLGRTHITRSGGGSTTVSPPPAPPPRAAAVRGSAPSGQYPGPPGSPRARHRAGGS